MTNSIETKGLTRSYQTYQKPEGVLNSIKGFWSRTYQHKIALAPTDLVIPAGQIVGLVGANGAGKTTLLKLLSGLIHPTAGDARVLGAQPWRREDKFLRKISILLGQKNQLWWDLAPADSFALLYRIYDLDVVAARKRVEELAQILDCAHVLTTQLRRLSLGERMKMELIGALLHEPEVLFLDEPTIGLDVVAQSAIRIFIADYVKKKRPTVILTSHYMDDIAKLANRLLLISQGAIVYDGTVDKFITRVEPKKVLKLQFETDSLPQDIDIGGGHFLKAGTLEATFSLKPIELPHVLQKVTAIGNIKDLKIEEVNFEEVIHDFLEKESRLRQTSRSH
jgi:ABC-2 type transport system ATP-binding protein